MPVRFSERGMRLLNRLGFRLYCKIFPRVISSTIYLPLESGVDGSIDFILVVPLAI